MPRVPTSRFVALSASAPWAAESMSCLPDWKSAAAGVTALQSSRHRWNDQAARRRFARLLRDRTALRFRGSFVTARVKIAAARAIRQSLAFLYTHLGVAIAAVEGSGLLHSGPGVNWHRSVPPEIKRSATALPAVSSAATC